MPGFHGQFVWCELMTADAAAAAEFYCAVIGWNARDAGAPHVGYTILSAGETGVGGLMEMPQSVRDAGGQPGWIGYIGADDVDAAAARVKEAGGRIHRAAEDIPDVGRFAVVADPQGSVFTLFRPLGGEAERPAAGNAPGRVGWHELHAADRESAFAFYAGLFGWTKTEAIDMGPMGIYQTFATGHGGAMVGGMMTKADPARRPGWLYYFNVDDIDAAAARATGAGGQVISGPHQVPGGGWIVHCTDAQGVAFAMTGPRHETAR